MSENKIYVLTHCESCYNRRGIFTGIINSKLTEEGKRQAKQRAKKLKNKQIDVAFSSSLTRAKQTLFCIIKYHPGAKVVIDDRIIERDYGLLAGKSKEKYKYEHSNLFTVYHRSYDVAPPQGESMKEVERRVLSFLKDILVLVKKEKVNVLIVCHGNSIRPIRRYFEHLSPKSMMKLNTYNHKIFIYRIKS